MPIRTPLAGLCCAFALALVATASATAPGQLEILSSPQPSSEMPPSLALRDARVSVLVRLEGEPAWRRYQNAGGRLRGTAAMQQAEQARSGLVRRQAVFLQSASALGARAGRQFQFIGNIVMVDVEAKRLPELARLPGVLAVGINRRYERNHSTSMPLARASAAWGGAALAGTSFTGRGVTIGIIDDGIDYTHRHFGGGGNYEDNDRTVLGDIAWPPSAPPAAMGDQLVIGGFDFVGDNYNGSLPPQPDPDPAGCPFSHGTHVAGSAAGYGVRGDGSTFTGDLTWGNLLFPDFPLASVADWRIGPGAAPRADLVSLRVFGCGGSTGTDILLAAMEYAATQTFLGESIDVVNMSLGSAYGGSGPDDFLNGAQQALVELGIVVVASAGNSGDVQLVSGAPASAAATISVANITDSSVVIDGSFRYVDPTDGNTQVSIAAAKGVMYPGGSPDPLTAQLAIANPILACGALSEPTPTAWDGKWLLVDRGGGCTFSLKVANVKATGAAGAIVVNSDGSPPFAMGLTAGVDDALPAIMVGQSGGNALKTLAAIHTFQGTFDGSVSSSAAETPVLASTTTSRGGVLRGNDRILKPNIAAPGSTITSAGAGTNDRGYTISGTSMAAPHVAGIAALLIEAHGRPTDAAGVALIKQRLMSSATRDIALLATDTAPFHSPQRVGAGLVDAVAALDARLVAYATDAPENVALSFGYPRHQVGTPALQQTKAITLRNLGNTPLLVSTSYQPRSTWPGAAVAVTPAQVEVPALGEAQVQVALSVDAAQANLNVSGDPVFVSGLKTFLHEVSGYAAFSVGGGGQSIRVPVYAAPHPTANTQAQDMLLLANAVATTPLPIGGTGFDLGSDANDHVSLVSAYQHLASSGILTDLFWDANGSGTNEPGERLTDYLYADIAHVGVSTHVASPTRTQMYLGLAMHGEWTSPRDLLVEAYVDVNNDGNDDYVWFYNSGATGGRAIPSDEFTVSFYNLLNLDFVHGFRDQRTGLIYQVNYAPGVSLNSMLLRNNVLSLPIVLRDPAFASSSISGPNYESGPVRLTVVTYQRDSDFSFPIDVVQTSFTPSIAISTPDGFNNLAFAANGNRFDITHDFTGASTVPSILTLHHHQHDPAQRAQVTALVLPAQPFDLLTPADGASFANATAIGEFTWQVVPSATAYNVTMGALGFSGTPAEDGDNVVCEAGTCRLLATPLALGPGAVSWNVQAVHPAGDVNAANGPFGFGLQGAVPDLIFRNGFEQP
jgi:subtilisin family serine protease